MQQAGYLSVSDREALAQCPIVQALLVSTVLFDINFTYLPLPTMDDRAEVDLATSVSCHRMCGCSTGR